MTTDDERAQIHGTRELLTAYFTASTQADLDACEATLRARSAGPLATVETVRPSSHEQAWLGHLHPVPGGLRSAGVFGDRHVDRLIRIAHLDLVAPVPHPGGGHTRLIPIIGPDLRLPIEADGVLGESPCDALYGQLGFANWILGLATDDPGMSAHMRQLLEHTLARLAAGWRDHGVWDAWSAPEGPADPPLAPPAQPDSGAPHGTPLALRVFDDGTALVAYPRALVRVRLRDGKVLRIINPHRTTFLWAPSPELAIMTAQVPTGGTIDVRAAAIEATARALAAVGEDATGFDFSDVPDDEPETVTRAFALDLTTGRWTQRPPDTRGVWFTDVVEKSGLADERGRHVRLLHVPDNWAFHAFTPDHRFLWAENDEAGGGVFRTRDAALVTMRALPEDHEVVRMKKTGTLAPGNKDWQRSEGEHAAAIARSPRGHWLLLCNGVVAEDWRPFLALDGPSRLAAFSDDATTLCIVTGNTVRCIDVSASPPRQQAAWSLAPLHKAARSASRGT